MFEEFYDNYLHFVHELYEDVTRWLDWIKELHHVASSVERIDPHHNVNRYVGFPLILHRMGVLQ